MIREEDPRFKNLEKKIGLFIAVSIIGIIVAIVLIGVQKDYFSKKYNLHFTVDRGTGFSKGMSVKLSGFRVGRIVSIALNDQAMVDIVVEIDNKYSKWIRNDSTVKLVKEGLVGDSIVDVSVGSLDKPELKHDDAIVYVKTKALDELADEIADKVKPVLIEVRDIISYINNPDGDLKKAVHNLEVLTKNLDGTRKNADSFIKTANSNLENVSQNTNIVLKSVNNKIDSIDIAPTLTKVNSTLATLDSKVPALLEKTDRTLENISKVSLETRILAEKTFPKIPGMMSQAEEVMLSTDHLLKSIQNNWLFKSTDSPPENSNLIKGDSFE